MSSSMLSSLQKAENNAVLPERFFKVTLGSLDAGALAVLPNKKCQPRTIPSIKHFVHRYFKRKKVRFCSSQHLNPLSSAHPSSLACPLQKYVHHTVARGPADWQASIGFTSANKEKPNVKSRPQSGSHLEKIASHMGFSFIASKS